MTGALQLDRLVVRLVGMESGFNKMFKDADKKMLSLSERSVKLGKALSLKVTVPLAVMGAISVREFARFDDAMTKSTAIMSGVTDDIRRQMEETAIAISNKGVKSSEELARSYFYLASAGLDAEKSMASLGVVTNFAMAGAFDMARATDLLTDAQSALGLASQDTNTHLENMTRLADVLVKANTLANATVEQFAKSLTTKSGAALRLLNKDVEEGVAVLAAMADQGVKAELAGERLNIILRDLQRASRGNEQVWKDLSVEVFDAGGNMRNIADIIEDLERALDGMSDRQRGATLAMMGFQDRSVSAMAGLLGLSDKIREYEQELRSAAGTTDDVANKQLQSFSAQLAITRNQLSNIAIGIGRDLAPMLRLLNSVLSQGIRVWNSIPGPIRLVLTYLGLIPAAIGPILFLVPTMVTWYAKLAAVYGAAAVSSKLFIGSLLIKTISLANGIAITIAATVANYGYAGSIKAIGMGLVSLPAKLMAAAAASKFFSGSLLAGKLGALGLKAGLVALTGYISFKVTQELNGASAAQRKWNEAMERGAEQNAKLRSMTQDRFQMRMEEISFMDSGERKSVLEAEAKRLENEMKGYEWRIRMATERRHEIGDVGNWTLKNLINTKEIQENLAELDDLNARMEQTKGLKRQVEQEMQRLEFADTAAQREYNAQIAEYVRQLELQNETFGMSSRQVEIYKFQVSGASEEDLNAMRVLADKIEQQEMSAEAQKRLNDEIESATQAMDRHIESLHTQIATFGMSSREAELYRLANQHVTQSQLDAATAAINHLEALEAQRTAAEEYRREMERGARLMDQYRDPLDKFNDTFDDILYLFDIGAIDAITFDKAVADALDKLDDLEPKQIEIRIDFRGIDAVEAGSAEALARLDQFRQEAGHLLGDVTAGTPGDITAQQNLVVQKDEGHADEVETLLERIAVAIEDDPAPRIELRPAQV